MTTINQKATISDLVTERPGRSRVFQSLGIEFCCAGDQTVSEACEKRGLQPDTVIAMLEADDANPQDDDMEKCAAMTLTELVEHILNTHHAYLTRELPRIGSMAAKVAQVHGEKDPRLADVARIYDAFAAEMNSHKMKEERILFPAICNIDNGQTGGGCPFGSISNPIRAMEAEHENAGNALARMRELTDGFTPPDWACNTYRALLDALNELETDTHRHVHKENHILFPKAIEAESHLT